MWVLLAARLVDLLVVGMATGAISMTITKAVVFRGVRRWITTKSAFLGKLFSCPYCMSHWVAGVFWIQADGVWDWASLTFATVALSAMVCGKIFDGLSGLSED